MTQNEGPESLRDLLINREQLRYQLLLDQDFTAYADLCHPDLIFLHTTGERENLDSFIAKNRAGTFRYSSVHHPIDTVTVTGMTAVLVGDLRAELLVDGKPFLLRNRVVATWINSGDDDWKLLAHTAVSL